ncbi:P-loop NTPase fold protein [uncultured Sphingomonas sp.]|uniref:P-loop NTPase fold protein n=1 Tax=uncultured Sphingomonas sp. TaxID=158754 RepID=UPI001577315B
MVGRIAEILSAANAADGRVIAIRDAWGFGKSSLKNMVAECIGDRFPAVRILDFNPWQWGDDQAIMRALFTQMAGKLGGSHSSGALARARALRRYGALLVGSGKGAANLGHNATAMTSLVASSALISAVLGITVPGIRPVTVSLAIVILGTLALILGRSLNWIGRDAAADALDDVRADLQCRLSKSSNSTPVIGFARLRQSG